MPLGEEAFGVFPDEVLKPSQARGVIYQRSRVPQQQRMQDMHVPMFSRTSRALQQGGEVVGVVVVTTAEGLQEAVASGAEHIEIQRHLDLTTLPLVNSMLLGEVPRTLKSIRVRCCVLSPSQLIARLTPCHTDPRAVDCGYRLPPTLLILCSFLMRTIAHLHA